MDMLQTNPTSVTLRGGGVGGGGAQLQLAWTRNGQVLESTEFKQCFVKANSE